VAAATADVATAAGASVAGTTDVADRVLGALHDLSFDLDYLSVELFISLCRAESAIQVAQEAEAEYGIIELEVLKFRALQGIAVWLLVVLVRAVGNRGLTGRWLWEWSSGDPFSIFFLTKGLLAEGKMGHISAAGGLNFGIDTGTMPVDLRPLQDTILCAVLALASPDVVFLPTAGYANNDVDITEQNKKLHLHRAFLASAAADCGFVDVLVVHLCNAFEPQPGLPVGRAPWCLRVAAFLAALVTPPPATEVNSEMLLRAAGALAGQLSQRSDQLWLLLGAVPDTVSTWSLEVRVAEGFSLRGFLRDCSAIAHAVAPSIARAMDFLRGCLRPQVDGEACMNIQHDARSLAALTVFAANAGISPGNDPLTDALGALPQETVVLVAGCLGGWRGPSRADVLPVWAAMLGGDAAVQCPPEVLVEDSFPPLYDQVECGWSVASVALAPLPEACLQVHHSDPAAPAVDVACDLRSLLHGAPPELCCAYDGKLLVDPVRSPAGYVFERTVLEKALAMSGGLCPITAVPLALAECPRDRDLRLRAVRWVREQKRPTAASNSPYT